MQSLAGQVLCSLKVWPHTADQIDQAKLEDLVSQLAPELGSV